MTKALTKFRRRRRWLRVATAIAGALVAAGVYVTLARAEDVQLDPCVQAYRTPLRTALALEQSGDPQMAERGV